MHRGFAGGDTFLFLLARELDDQDGVLGGQADENDEADLRSRKNGLSVAGHLVSSVAPLLSVGKLGAIEVEHKKPKGR